MAESIVQIKSAPGIKRDGTRFEGEGYVDGQWVRFQRGLPRKIGGYRSINKYLRGLPRALHGYTRDELTYIHAGSAELLERFYIDSSNNTSVISDRTPASLVADDRNLWQFDADYLAAASTMQLLAQVAPNGDQLTNSAGGQLFYGDLFDTTALTELTITPGQLPTGFNCTGGIVILHPYAFAFGNDGYIAWSVAGDMTDFDSAGSGSLNATGQKIVRGLPLRGGPGNSPSGLFWSADSLVRASFVGGTEIFQFDTISGQSSILSAQSAIEYDGIYYWLGIDRMLMFNGVVREVENNMNINFFYDNVNHAYANRTFAIKVPRFGEIWWCFPFGDSTEPNHAIIYNVRENCWYDCALPNSGRGAGLFPSVFRKPLMSGVEQQNHRLVDFSIDDAGTGYVIGDVLTVVDGDWVIQAQLTVDTVGGGGDILTATITEAGSYSAVPSDPVVLSGGTGTGAEILGVFEQPYKFWVHEVGTNEIDGTDINPIQSYFETSDLALPVTSQINKSLVVGIFEPDFNQVGDLTVLVTGRANARSNEVESEAMVITETPGTPEEQVVYFKTQRRELRFRFESNTVNGDYEMGLCLAHLQPGDETVLG